MFYGKKWFCLLVVCLVFNLNVSSGTDLPEFMHVCPKGTADMSACLMDSVEAIRPYLKTGSPEHNIPSVEPIYIKELIKEESAGIKLETSDVIAYGGGDFSMKDAKLNFEQKILEFDIIIPKLAITAKYGLDGKIIMVPIKGNGEFTGNLTDLTTHASIHFDVVNKDGEDHLVLTACNLKVKIGGGTIHLANLFNGDKTLNTVINDTINKNLGPFLKELLPYIEKALGENFLNTGNQIIAPYTMSQLFP